MKQIYKNVLAFALVCTALSASCEKKLSGSDGGDPVETPEDLIIVGGYSMAGRMTSFNPKDYPYMQYPSRVYCFGLAPSADGKWYVNPSFEQKIKVMRQAMLPSQECFLVMGGGTSKNMYVMGMDKTKREAFAKALVAYAHENGYDGIDIDWETVWSENPPLRVPEKELSELLLGIREEMQALPAGTKLKYLTVALSSIDHVLSSKIQDYVDQINVMIYDCYGEADEDGVEPHAPMSQFKERLGNYASAGVKKEKMVVGVPFYGGNRQLEGTPHMTYDVIYEQSGGSITAAANSFEGYAFNGYDLIREKTQYLLDNGYAGIMVWEISHDIDYGNPLSLMRAIKSVTQKK